MTDAELVEAVRSQDAGALGILIERHGPRVRALCHRVTGSAWEAEELAHETFVEAYLKLAQLREPARFAAWTRQIALNLCRMWLRRRPKELALSEDLPDESAPEGDTDFVRVAFGLSRLGAAHRVVLVLYYLEGLSYEEIATFLEVPLGTVTSRLHRARHTLRAQLAQGVTDDEVPSMTIEQLKTDVEAEIAVLLDAFDQKRGQAERLRVVLRSPERFARLMVEVHPDNLRRLAMLLPRLGGDGMDAALSLSLGDDHDGAKRARSVLRTMIAQGQCTTRGGFRGMPTREAYLLVDRIFARELRAEVAAELLLDLLDAAPTGPLSALLLSALTCYRDAAFSLLRDQFLQTRDLTYFTERPYLLHAACRFGAPFAMLVLEALRGADRTRDAVALAGAEALCVALRIARGEGNVAVEARRTAERLAPCAIDAALERDLLEAVAAHGAHPNTALREMALRALAAAHALAHTQVVHRLLDHPALSTRCLALHTLAELGADDALDDIMRAAKSSAPTERCAALSAVARLRAERALPLISSLLEDPDASVMDAAIVALGELGSAQADAALQALLQSDDPRAYKAAARVLFGRPSSEPKWTPSPATTARLARLRGGVTPLCQDQLGPTMRHAVSALRTYDEQELTQRIAAVCVDFSAARRHLIEQGIMTREDGTYELTRLGEAIFRVERFIATHTG